MIFNIGSGAPSGEILVVTAPAGVTVSVSKDTKTKTKIADSNGLVTFKGLGAGTWTVSITDGTQTSSKTIKIETGYTLSIGFFSATITVTYPAGSTCTCSDGTTTLTAADTTGSYTFTVPNAGTWTVTSTDGSSTKSETVEITTSGQNGSVELSYKLYLVDGVNDCTSNWTCVDVIGKDTTATGTPTLANENGVMIASQGNTTADTKGGSVYSTLIDMTKYGKLYCNVTTENCSDEVGHAYIAVGTYDSSAKKYTFASVDGERLETDKILETGLFELDVSTLSGEYSVVIQLVARNGKKVNISFNSIYLE